MKHIQNYELFEGVGPLAKQSLKSKLPNIQVTTFIPDGSGINSGKWLKEEYDFDLGPLMTQLNKFAVKATTDQYPNMIKGVKGEEFAKYMDVSVNKLVSEYVKKIFNGPAKGKKMVIKGLYILGGKEKFVKDLADKYLNKKMGVGQRNLIETILDHSTLGTSILEILKKGPITETEAEKKAIGKWITEYNSYFKDKNKHMNAILSSIASGIWN